MSLKPLLIPQLPKSLLLPFPSFLCLLNINPTISNHLSQHPLPRILPGIPHALQLSKREVLFPHSWPMSSQTFSWGFPHSSEGKESACNERDPGSFPGSGRSLGEGNGNPLQYSFLENPMDREAWWATVHGVTRVRYNLATKPSPHTQWPFLPPTFQALQVTLTAELITHKTASLPQ